MINTHAKLLAINFLSLTPNPDSSFSLPNAPTAFTRAETVGVVTSVDLKPNKFLRFTLDDSTANIPCILWLNHRTSPYFSRRSPVDVKVIGDVADEMGSVVRLGEVVRVRGRIGVFRGTVQLTVSDVVSERDPNAEVMHWLECLKLAKRCYGICTSTASA